MAAIETKIGQRDRLRVEGYCIFERVLDDSMLALLTKLCDQLVGMQSTDEAKRFRYQGSMIPIKCTEPILAQLITWPRALEIMDCLGFKQPKWLSGYVISKPPHGSGLWWHQDWWAWDEPCSLWDDPPQLFLMYYLTDTDRDNGCLRIIPGTHRKCIALHDQLPPGHSDEINQYSEDSIVHRKHVDEIDIPVRSGDVVVGDVRILHASHPNRSNHRRTCITLWYVPQFASLPARLRAHVAQQPSLPREGVTLGLQPELARALNRLIPRFVGYADPVRFNRTPSRLFK